MKKIRVMIVDGHKVVREGLRALLREDPDVKIVGEAVNGQKALDTLEALHPDIVLLDVPGIDGVDVCREMGARCPETAVIGLSNVPDEHVAGLLIQAGAKGYILKDVESGPLQQILRTVLTGESVIDPNIVNRLIQQKTAPDPETPSKGELTVQQLTILQLIGQGLSNKEIATYMILSEYTIKSYIQDLLQKIHARNRVQAAMIAYKEGWI